LFEFIKKQESLTKTIIFYLKNWIKVDENCLDIILTYLIESKLQFDETDDELCTLFIKRLVKNNYF
jgi:hypothetical protein